MPWTGRAGPNGLVRTGCRERVGWDALGRPSRPEWVGPCTVWIRSFWFETAVPGLLFPCASGRCLPCFVPLSPMPRPHLLAPGRCLPVLRTAAFRALFRCLLCLARTSLYPGVASCSPRPASLSPRPRSFLPFGLHPLALRTTLFCVPARFLLLSSLHPRSSPGKRKPPKALPSGVSGYCRSRITSQEPSG